MKLPVHFATLVTLLPVFVFAQGTGAPRDPRATALATQALTSMGSSATYCTLQGNVALSKPTLSMPVVLKNSGTSELRVELSTQKGTNLLLVNAGAGEVVQANGKIVQLSRNNTVFRRIPHLPMFSILSEHDAPTTKLEYLSTTTANSPGVALSLWSDSSDSDQMARMTRTVFAFDPLSSLVT